MVASRIIQSQTELTDSFHQQVSIDYLLCTDIVLGTKDTAGNTIELLNLCSLHSSGEDSMIYS